MSTISSGNTKVVIVVHGIRTIPVQFSSAGFPQYGQNAVFDFFTKRLWVNMEKMIPTGPASTYAAISTGEAVGASTCKAKRLQSPAEGLR